MGLNFLSSFYNNVCDMNLVILKMFSFLYQPFYYFDF